MIKENVSCPHPDHTKPDTSPEAVCPCREVWPNEDRSNFYGVREIILKQIGYPDDYPLSYRASAIEIASIITEVKLLEGYYPISICGEQLPAGLVADVYRELTSDHIRHVIKQMCERPDVRRRRQYLRSALYNVAMELDISVLADISKYFGITKQNT